MLLEGKNAVVYGGGGKVGGAVARAFAGEGARVFPGVYVGDSGSRARRSKLSQSSLRLRPDCIRVNGLRSEGIPESWEGASTGEWSAPPEEIEAFLKQRSFLASDRAAATAGTVINLTSGTVVE